MNDLVGNSTLQQFTVGAVTLDTPTYIGPTKPQTKYFDTIENRESAKPWGGLWTSPKLPEKNVISPYSGFENRALVLPHHEVWHLQPKESSTVLYIDTVDKLESLPTHQPRAFSSRSYLDYEEIFTDSGADGIHITGDVAHIKSFATTHHLGSWDFTSTLWNNLEWIKDMTFYGQVKDN